MSEEETGTSREEKIKECIDNFDPTKRNSASLYLIRKRNTDDQKKKFDVSSITLDGDPVNSFVDVLRNRLLQIKRDLTSKQTRLMDFYDEGINSEDISELEPKKIQGFVAMIEKMEKYDQQRNIKNLNDGEKFDFYAFELQFDSGRVIYFRKTSYKTLISKEETRMWHRLLDGKLTKVEGDIFTFDEIVHCVYFEELDSIIVIDKYNTENMFEFKEYYTKYAIEKLKDLQKKGSIKISQDMLKLDTKIQLCRRITSVDKANRFNKTTENFIKCQNIFKLHDGEYREELTQIDIKENVLNIDTDDKLETYVHLSNQDIVQDIINEEMFISMKKESMKKKSK